MSLALPDCHRTLIVGAAGSLGRACVRTFAEAGATVCAADLALEAAQGTVAGLVGDHDAIAMDVSNPEEVQAMADRLCADAPFDSVVFCAGLAITSTVAAHDWAAYRRLMSVNLDGAFHVGQSFVRPMHKTGKPGSFVFIGSVAGLRGEAAAAAYCASKAGLHSFVDAFAAENTCHGIRANSVAPGSVDSDMIRQVAQQIADERGASYDEIFEEVSHKGAATRLVTPEEVANACLWLASPLSSGVTGTTIRVDVGQLLDRF